MNEQFRVVTIPMDAETAEQVRADLVEQGVKPHGPAWRRWSKMTECERCGEVTGEDEHWVHLSVFHWERPGHEGQWSKDDPANYALALCPSCYADVEAVLESDQDE